MNRYEHILTTIIRYGIYALLFTPLIVSPNTIFPFHFGRILMIQAIIGVLLGVWLILIYLEPKYRPQKSLLLIVLSIYFGILFLSSFFGVDFDKSFWGNEERMGGFFTLMHFFVLFLIARSIFKRWKDWEKIFCISLFASILVSIIALAQRQGYMNLWGIIGEGRISGTIGNPIFLAAYLLFHIFLAFLLTMKISDGRYKILVASAGLFNIFTLFLAETRGALIAFMIGIFLVFVGYLFFTKNKKTRIVLGAVLFIGVIFSLFIWLNRDTDLVKRIPGLNKLTVLSLETLKEGTGKTRLLTWGSSIDAWKEKSILGWGLDNFNIAFNKYYNPELLDYSIYETWFDRAHNVFFDHLVMAGILGLLSYLSIFVVVLLMLYKFFRQKIIDKHIFIFLSALPVVYLIQNLFVFDTAISYLMFFLCLALVDTIKKHPQVEINEQKRDKPRLLIFLFLLIPFASILFNLQLYRASAGGMEGSKLVEASLETRVSHFKSALEMPTPYKEEIRADLVSTILAEFINKIILASRAEEYFKEAETVILENIREHPRHTFYYFILGRLYAEMGVYDSKYFAESEKMFQKALEFSPKRQQIYYGLGRLYLAQEDYHKAIEALNTMVDLEPNAHEPHWFLGTTLLAVGEEEKGYEEIRKSYKLGYYPKTTDDIFLIKEAFLLTEEYKYLIKMYESRVLEGVIIPPADFCAQVAVIYKERGEIEKAIEAALRAAKLDPSFAEEAEVFIKMLGL